MNPSSHSRYSRQILFPSIGEEGQRRLQASKVAIVGLGALGSVLADHMVRAGIGYVRLIDRDFVEESNLQRQMLYDEEDAAQSLPKAVAAANKLRRINSGVTVEAVVADLNAENGEALLSDLHLILDGSDNYQVRYLINDVAVKYGIPWIHGAAVRSRGLFAVIRPGITPCYRCLFPNVPEARGDTCDTVGVIGPIVHLIASYQAAEALKLLVGDEAHLNPYLEQLDVWENQHQQIHIEKGRNPDCPACVHHRFDFLDARMEQERYLLLCGRDTVQVLPRGRRTISLAEMAKRLRPLGEVVVTDYLLRFEIPPYRLVLFPDGRLLVHGTHDLTAAKSLYAKYIGT